MKKKLVSGVASLLLAFGATAIATPASAVTPTGGTVTCNQEIVGVWVVQDGNSGWASLSNRYGNWDKYWSYNVNPNKSWHLRVGCGGTPQSWDSNIQSPTMTYGGNKNITCVNYPWWYTAPDYCVRS